VGGATVFYKRYITELISKMFIEVYFLDVAVFEAIYHIKF